MLKILKVGETESESVKAVSAALKEVGLGEFADVYYNEGHQDFFKITKGEENVVHAIYIDVDDDMDEFSVHGFYGHEHYSTLGGAIECARALYFGELCEMLLILPTLSASAFVNNNCTHEENVMKFIQTVVQFLQKELVMDSLGHMHIHSQDTYSMIKFEVGEHQLQYDSKLIVRHGVMGNESDDVHFFQ